MRKFKIISLKEALNFIPQDCFYASFDPSIHGLYKPVFYLHEGDLRVDEPFDLDAYIFDDDEKRQTLTALIVTGDMSAQNIYNAENDSSCGLVVLGNLSAKNIAVGGQQIYVAGDFFVSELYWGDYNHGDLIVKGRADVGLFLSTDYDFDVADFYAKDAKTSVVLTDNDDEEKIQNALALRVAVREELLLPRGWGDEIYSYKDHLDERAVFHALSRGESLLVSKERQNERLAQIEAAKFKIFSGAQISKENMFAFTYPPYFSLVCKPDKKGAQRFEMWEDDIFYRVKFNPANGTQSVYIQNDEEFAVVVALEKGELSLYAWDLKSEDMPCLDAQSDPAAHEFLLDRWAYWQTRYTEIIEARINFLRELPTQSLEAAFTSERLGKYERQKDRRRGRVAIELDVWGEIDEKRRRVEITEKLEDERRVYIYECEDGRVVLSGRDDESEYEVSFGNTVRYQNAVRFFNKFIRQLGLNLKK